MLTKLYTYINTLMPRVDRLKHFYIFTLLFILGGIISPITSLIIIIIGAFLKEVSDIFREDGSGFDIIDLLYSILGPILIYNFLL